MSYHSVHLEFPALTPYDQENWFETFVGRFVKPLLKTGKVKQYWFTRYGGPHHREVRLRLTTDDYESLRPVIEVQIGIEGFTDLADELDATVNGNLGGDRFHSPDSSNDSSERRGQLMLNFLHALSELFVDSLVGPDADGRYRQERNADINNPNGSIFETVHHLLCNISGVVTEVELFGYGQNILEAQGPLYASHRKADLRAQGLQVLDFAKFRVSF